MGVREQAWSADWTVLRATAVTAGETLGSTGAITSNYFDNNSACFVDLKFEGTLSASHSFNVNVVEIDAAGTATVVKHAFKDGSTTLTVNEDCVVPMVAARGRVGVVFTGEVGTSSVTAKIRRA